MQEQIKRLHEIIQKVQTLLRSMPDNDLRYKSAPGKWSKIEILGHLVDSGINNLQRFNEAQFKSKPFSYANYQQDDLVLANKYQDAALEDIISLYQSLNLRIIEIIKSQTEETLAYPAFNESNEKAADLKFLMNDYVDHMEHHLKQLMR